MKRYNITVDKIYHHRHFATYKLCPGEFFPWDAFIKVLKEQPDNKEEILQLIENASASLEKVVALLKKEGT